METKGENYFERDREREENIYLRRQPTKHDHASLSLKQTKKEGQQRVKQYDRVRFIVDSQVIGFRLNQR